MSPDMFAGADVFAEQMDHLSDRCRTNKPINPVQPVRVPGDAAAKSIADAQKNGISYDAAVWTGLCGWAGKLGVEVPASA
jgi:LDH2 family malate/lactate/ureidoglycolate dehydrogenase